MYSNFHHTQDDLKTSNPESTSAEDHQVLPPLDIASIAIDPRQWDNVAQLQFNPALPKSSADYPYNPRDTIPVSSTHRPVMTPSMPIWITPGSAPSSAYFDDVSLRTYSTPSSLMPSPYTHTQLLPTPQFNRPASLPNVSSLYAATPPFTMPASYPRTFQMPDSSTYYGRHTHIEALDQHLTTDYVPLSAPNLLHPLQTHTPRLCRERVPQTLEMTSPDRYFKIDFAVDGVSGILVEDAINELVELDGGEDRPFTSNGSRQIRLVIKWPGYPDLGMYVPVKERLSASEEIFVTRKRFAGLVGQRIIRFANKMSKTVIKEDCKKWKIGNEPGAIKLEDLWLVSVTRASHNVWMAELEVQRRS